MNEIEFKMLLQYPFMLPTKDKRYQYTGYISVKGVDYGINLSLPSDDFEGYDVKITPQLQPFQKEIKNLIRYADGYNVLELLDKLRDILLAKTVFKEIINHSAIYRHVINEFVELREFYFNIHKCILNNNLSGINIAHIDMSGRTHQMIISVDYDEPKDIFKVSDYSLPNPIKGELFKPSNSMKALYEVFVNTIERLQLFFDIMDALNEICWILDPLQPTRKDCYRRIALGNTSSVILTLDPWFPTNPPDLKFLGPERITNDLREKVSLNLENWDRQGDYIQEILKLLEIESFPTNENKNANEAILYDSGDCCICFSSRLNDKLPEIICPNTSCEQFFHQECLHQWLISVNHRKNLNEVYGNCPNCEKHISCPTLD